MKDAITNLDEILEYLHSVAYLLHKDQGRLEGKINTNNYSLMLTSLADLENNINNQKYIIEESMKKSVEVVE